MSKTKLKKQVPANTKNKAQVKKVNNGAKTQDIQDEDVIHLILADHKPLKQLIKIMKNSEEYDLNERQNAFEEFAPLLVTHAKPEEQTMYIFMKENKDLREKGFEGEVEHGLADQLVEEIKRTDNEDLWSARVKVLAELVEHHIEEEEEELLPAFRKHSENDERSMLGAKFLRYKAQLEAQGGKDSLDESMGDDEKSIKGSSTTISAPR